jgi:hypothetical protein
MVAQQHQADRGPGVGVAHIGWRTEGPVELEALTGRLTDLGVGEGWNDGDASHGPAFSFRTPGGIGTRSSGSSGRDVQPGSRGPSRFSASPARARVARPAATCPPAGSALPPRSHRSRTPTRRWKAWARRSSAATASTNARCSYVPGINRLLASASWRRLPAQVVAAISAAMPIPTARQSPATSR